ncbi:MAG: hypothetical protein IJJ26_04570 [Victivallales bacterium]|nr:hypothetical protein [Victivallales bacterium]
MVRSPSARLAVTERDACNRSSPGPNVGEFSELVVGDGALFHHSNGLAMNCQFADGHAENRKVSSIPKDQWLTNTGYFWTLQGEVCRY